MKDLKETPVKEGGSKIADFEDARLAIIELSEKHNALVESHTKLRNKVISLDSAIDRPYGLKD